MSAGSLAAGTDRWHLLDQRDFLRRSLDDALAEFEAGDLDRQDYEALQRRDQALLDGVEAALAELPEEEPGPQDHAAEPETAARKTDEVDGPASESVPVRRRSRLLAVVGVLSVLAGVGILVSHVVAPRLAGQDSSGTVNLNATQRIEAQLSQATALVDAGNTREALNVYQQVLVEDPNQPQALAETGWLYWESGALGDVRSLVTRGKAFVEKSLSVQPNDYVARLYLGTILYKQGPGSAAAAAAQFKDFLAENPPTSAVTAAAPDLRQAFAAAREPVPPLP